MGKIIKNNLADFLIVPLIFLIVGLWFFSGWPQIWQSPSVPPEIQEVSAATETKRPQTASDGASTLNEANAHDVDPASQSDTTVATATADPEFTVHNWPAAGQTYTSLSLIVKYEATAATDDTYAIHYSINNTSGACDSGNWNALVAATTLAAGDGTIVSTPLALDQNLTQLCVKIVLVKAKNSDNAHLYIEDVRTEGEYALNATPTVTNLDLGSAITLTEGTTTNATCTATINDTDGGATIVGATATIYRTGVTRDCVDNDNNCYRTTTCNLSASSNGSKNATCTAQLWFHADPTDNGSWAVSKGWDSQTWQCHITGTDNQGATGSSTDQNAPPDINSTAALIITSAIDYGTLAPSASTSLGASSQTTATTTGNIPIDVKILGKDMRSYDAYIFGGDRQQYATSDVEWESPADEGTAVSTSTYATLDLDSTKPTQHEPVQSAATDIIYWKVGIPVGQQLTTYYSTTTIAAAAD